MKFSANLGFLWADRPLADAIRAAKAAGFDAVECHWPYAEPVADVKAALSETGLPMLGLNTVRGAEGENGLSALVGREEEARAAIDQAIDYGAEIGAGQVHVMAGFAEGNAARRCFVENLRYAAGLAEAKGMGVLIEPLNRYDAPGYFLQTTGQALGIISDVAVPNLRLMFDCYHVQLMEGDLTHKLEALMADVGHIQFAGVPARGRPDEGEVNFGHVFGVIERLGWELPLGAEYKPGGDTDATLGWLSAYR